MDYRQPGWKTSTESWNSRGSMWNRPRLNEMAAVQEIDIEMSESTITVLRCTSPECGRALYGPVSFCPFCGADQTTGEALDECRAEYPKPLEGEESLPAQQEEKGVSGEDRPAEMRSATDAMLDFTQRHEEDACDQEKERGKPPAVPQTGRSQGGRSIAKWKWATMVAAMAVFLGCLAFYWFIPPNGRGEAALLVALEGLRQGTGLSRAVGRLPKMEKVYQAALELQKISPRYQQEVEKAKNAMLATEAERDHSLIAYFERLQELSRFEPKDVSYALKVIRNGDPTPREKAALDLLGMHLNSLLKGSSADPKSWLSDFWKRFSAFVD